MLKDSALVSARGVTVSEKLFEIPPSSAVRLPDTGSS